MGIFQKRRFHRIRKAAFLFLAAHSIPALAKKDFTDLLTGQCNSLFSTFRESRAIELQSILAGMKVNPKFFSDSQLLYLEAIAKLKNRLRPEASPTGDGFSALIENLKDIFTHPEKYSELNCVSSSVFIRLLRLEAIYQIPLLKLYRQFFDFDKIFTAEGEKVADDRLRSVLKNLGNREILFIFETFLRSEIQAVTQSGPALEQELHLKAKKFSTSAVQLFLAVDHYETQLGAENYLLKSQTRGRQEFLETLWWLATPQFFKNFSAWQGTLAQIVSAQLKSLQKFSRPLSLESLLPTQALYMMALPRQEPMSGYSFYKFYRVVARKLEWPILLPHHITEGMRFLLFVDQFGLEKIHFRFLVNQINSPSFRSDHISPSPIEADFNRLLFLLKPITTDDFTRYLHLAIDENTLAQNPSEERILELESFSAQMFSSVWGLSEIVHPLYRENDQLMAYFLPRKEGHHSDNLDEY